MANVYLVSYDLHRPGQDYDSLIEELEESTGWWHYLESTWLVYTDEDVGELTERLRIHLDEDDEMLIIRVCRDYAGWLSEEAWGWIGEHVPECK